MFGMKHQHPEDRKKQHHVKHIKFIATNKDKIISYSDSCTEQNRNIKIALYMYKYIIYRTKVLNIKTFVFTE